MKQMHGKYCAMQGTDGSGVVWNRNWPAIYVKRSIVYNNMSSFHKECEQMHYICPQKMCTPSVVLMSTTLTFIIFNANAVIILI
jgi:hypothetical protein